MTPRPAAVDAALAALCQALGGYLSRLRAAWTAAAEVGSGPDAEIQRLIGAAGMAYEPGPDEVREFEALAGVVLRAGPGAEPFSRLGHRLDLDLGERLTVAAAWWAETDPQFAVLLGCGHDDGTSRHASAALLRLVLGPFGVALPAAWEPADPLLRLGVLEAGAGPNGPLLLTRAARRALAGRPPPAPEPDDGETPVPPGQHAAMTHAAALLRAGGAVLLRSATPLPALAAAAARAAGSRPLPDDGWSDEELRLFGRLGSGVPVVAAERLPTLRWTDREGPLLALGPAGAAAHGAHVLDVGRPNARRRTEAWRQELERAGIDHAAAAAIGARLGARLLLDGADVATAAAQAVREAGTAGRDVTEDDVWEVARRLARHELHRVAALVEPAFTLDDLVLPPDVRAQLDEVVTHVAMQDVVLDRWGFRSRLPRGQGVAVLLSGPPGTGKTMAAEALAAHLRQDLYRIDLSAVVSKYIGETEKNLALAFDEAEKAAAVLFFDECDALFGRRTEQRDAHDRWANLEVNFLLQRVETFTGLVVLATNRRQTLDEAFLRRLRFSIRFDLPDAVQRRELWLRSFPAETPTGELDVTEFAARELAGGSVQSAALAAAFRAAADGGRVRREHVTHALRREFDKLGKVWTEGGP